jgi:hypothetical protein
MNMFRQAQHDSVLFQSPYGVWGQYFSKPLCAFAEAMATCGIGLGLAGSTCGTTPFSCIEIFCKFTAQGLYINLPGINKYE